MSSLKLIVMSDLHLSQKPWKVRKALRYSAGADVVLLAGDLTNDGTEKQMVSFQQCIQELLPENSVLAVTGNHDYPMNPIPMITKEICDYPSMQEWLLSRQPYPYISDKSGAYAVSIGEIEVIGLNCATHWRRFKFPKGVQLQWLSEHLQISNKSWHIIMCHAPLLAHNPLYRENKPYLSRDIQLQKILNEYENVIFISGHTHVSMESEINCIEYDESCKHIYINDGSVCPTTLLTRDGIPKENSADGNIVKIELNEKNVKISSISIQDNRVLVQQQIPL